MPRICCFTGHRDIKWDNYNAVTVRLEGQLRHLIENEGVTIFRAGGARGFDTLAAILVLKLKREYPHIKLHLLLPCKNQEKLFEISEKRLYRYVLANADEVKFINEMYSSGVMKARNRALVDGADVCVAYLSKSTGGTYQTVGMAKRAGVSVINVSG